MPTSLPRLSATSPPPPISVSHAPTCAPSSSSSMAKTSPPSVSFPTTSTKTPSPRSSVSPSSSCFKSMAARTTHPVSPRPSATSRSPFPSCRAWHASSRLPTPCRTPSPALPSTSYAAKSSTPSPWRPRTMPTSKPTRASTSAWRAAPWSSRPPSFSLLTTTCSPMSTARTST